METTINQFRELVTGLQRYVAICLDLSMPLAPCVYCAKLPCSEIDYLRTQHAEVQQETATSSKEAQALMNLNLKLQSTASKAQNKTVELELKKLEVAQLANHLRIVSVSATPSLVVVATSHRAYSLTCILPASRTLSPSTQH